MSLIMTWDTVNLQRGTYFFSFGYISHRCDIAASSIVTLGSEDATSTTCASLVDGKIFRFRLLLWNKRLGNADGIIITSIIRKCLLHFNYAVLDLSLTKLHLSTTQNTHFYNTTGTLIKKLVIQLIICSLNPFSAVKSLVTDVGSL